MTFGPISRPAIPQRDVQVIDAKCPSFAHTGRKFHRGPVLKSHIIKTPLLDSHGFVAVA